jgi:hypothetical protein
MTPLETSSGSRRPLSVLLMLVLLIGVYSISATWGAEGQTRDSLGTALPAWNLAEHGTLEMSEVTEVDAWLVETPHGVFSNRSPGLVLITALGYLVASPFVTDFVFWPATLVAVVTSALAIALVAKVGHMLAGAANRYAFLLVGLGTAVWGVASDQIWPHGPAALCVALAVYFLATDRDGLAGVALGVGLLIRPPLALLAAIVGIGLAISRRRMKPLVDLGVPTLIAAAAFLAYNHFIFGSWSVTAGYDAFGGLGRTAETASAWIRNISIALVSPEYGILLWSPWIVIGVLCLRRIWSDLPDWARWAPLAFIVYLVVHVRINRVSGGLPYNYRYLIEPIILISPVLMGALWRARRDKVLRAATWATALVAIGLQFAFVYISECVGIGTANPHCGLFGL